MYSNRLKKTPPKLRFAAMHRDAVVDKAADAYPALISTSLAHGNDPVPAKQSRKKHNFEDHAPQRSRLDLALSAAVAESSSNKISIDERERLLQQFTALKKRSPEDNLPDYSPMVPFSGTGYAQDAIKTGLRAGPQFQGQADIPRSNNVKPDHFWVDPAARLEESCSKRSPPTLPSVGPDPHRRYILPRYQKIKAAPPQHDTRSPYVPGTQYASEPQHAASGYPARGQLPFAFQHYIAGETYESFVARFNRRYGDFLDPENLPKGHKRSRHEMNAAEAETQPDFATAAKMPPKSVKKPDLEGSRKRYQAYAASVSSTDSTAEANLRGHKEESQDDVEKDLAAKMKDVSLDTFFPHKTPSEPPHGTIAGDASDRPSMAAPRRSRHIATKRKSTAKEDHQHRGMAQKKPEAGGSDNNSKTDLPQNCIDDNDPKKPERKAGTLKEPTPDNLDSLDHTVEREINAKHLESISPQQSASSRANLERLISQKQLEAILPSTNAPPPSSLFPRPSLLLTILPPELRRLIYLHLLTTPKPIHGGELLEDARTTIIIPATVPPTLTLRISAIVLRTCRTIYTEALPILYQENCFSFSKVSMLRIFRSKGLVMSQTPLHKSKSVLRYLDSISAHDFAFNPEPQGRLCLLRNVHLRFRHSGRPASLRGMRSPSGDEMEWLGGHLDHWTGFLNEERYADGAGYVTFPALKKLVVDFSDWELKPDEGLRVRVFEARFRGEKGLRSLTTVGLSHGGTVEALRGRLLGRGEAMRVLERGALGGVV